MKVEYNKLMNVPFNSSYITQDLGTPPMEINLLHFHSRELGKGETLYHVGDEAEAAFRIEEGLFKLSIDMFTGRERIISIVGPGDFVGAISPLYLNYSDTAEALSPRVRVTVIPSDQMDAEIKLALHKATGLHLLRVREALEDTELPVNARLARTLLRLGRRFGHQADDGNLHITLPLTHENFASMIGAARETTTAILGEMREAGLIQGTRPLQL
ncbi:MAG: Crp/Fnr family transcriptional regulator [Deinococcales bacterium]